MPTFAQLATALEGIIKILQQTNATQFVEMVFMYQQQSNVMTTIQTVMMVVLQLAQLRQATPALDLLVTVYLIKQLMFR